jgi:hypothetical protein
MPLYSHNKQYPSVIPFRIKLSDGRTRTDPSTFSPEEIADAGYIEVSNKPEELPNQVVFWSVSAVDWIVRAKTEQELQAESDIRRSKINGIRDARIARGFFFQGKMYDSRSEDQKRISGASQLAFMAIVAGAQPNDYLWASEEPFGWIAQDNSITLMDAQTVVDFGKTAAEWERKHIFAARELKNMSIVPENYKDDSWWPITYTYE